MHIDADHHDDQAGHNIECKQDIERYRRQRHDQHSHDREDDQRDTEVLGFTGKE